ncbi:MAG: Tex family protein [Armatimonadota bacterium]
MNTNHISRITEELNLNQRQVLATAELLGEGATVPFIARYRKEATGSLDEVAITSIRDRLEQLAELDKRREAIIQSLTERELLTDELEKQINAAETMAELEDIYLPYRPKRRTRATIAREKGLEPLAGVIMLQRVKDLEAEAAAFIDEEKGVATVEDALAGARDIIAEMVSEDQETRAHMRGLYTRKAVISSSVVKGKDEEGAKFKDYFEWKEPITSAPSHRVLAMMRGEKEGFLKLHIAPGEEEAVSALRRHFVMGEGPASGQVTLAVEDSYKRLLGPSMETEIRNDLKQRADQEAIRVFAENLRELLLSPPLGQKNLLALDPGFRTGCKVVCLDRQGKLIHNDTVYPHTGDRKAEEAGRTLRKLCQDFKIEVIAIGNGTASRETESFVRSLDLSGQIPVVIVNESGASIYSASDVAREEFPDYDVTVRGSVSIGRRLMDPLAELVKIDPKSIGVGQYQHDVDQTALKRSLDDVVESCVNGVGVDVNTASKQLLTYVSGLGPGLAQNIVKFRDENGRFDSRKQLKKVKGLGPKAFEQAAGFLRVRDGGDPLDASAVHPESYHIVGRMVKDLGCGVADLMSNEALRKQISLQDYADEKVGLPTLRDIMNELAKPGRDPREQFEVFQFAEGIEKMEDLAVGMKLPGVVTNVTAFGAFVDIGVHQDGLVHISHLADKFVRDPSEVVKVHQKVMVTVIGVDIPRKRISLSMKANPVV